METARLVLDYVDVLIWPIVVAVVLIAFRRQLVALFGRITRLDAAGVSASFTFAEAVEDVGEIVHLRDTEETEDGMATVTRLNAVLIRPTAYEDAREIVRTMRSGRALVLDLGAASDVDSKRLLDFAGGLVVGMRGEIEMLETPKSFLLIPPTSDADRRNELMADAERDETT